MDAPVHRNLLALKAVVAALVAMAGFSASSKKLPRHMYRVILRLLRPAEAAARRLVIVLARDVVVGVRALRPHGWKRGRCAALRETNMLTLPLFDPLKRFGCRRTTTLGVPRISTPGVTVPFVIVPRLPPLPDDPVDASRLQARLDALQRALESPDPLVIRMARWQARRRMPTADASTNAVSREWRMHRVSPLRPGRAPGNSFRAHQRHEVHDILEHAQELAHFALERCDTS
jgi:hypothetical protein